MARRGRPPKAGGRRVQYLTRVPETHADVYAERAADLGLPMTDYIAMRLAQAEGLAVPDYITDQLAASRSAAPREVRADAEAATTTYPAIVTATPAGPDGAASFVTVEVAADPNAVGSLAASNRIILTPAPIQQTLLAG